MNKTKKNGLLKIAGIMLVIMMLATCVVAGTMAKYTSTGNVSGIPGVTPAKWSIKVGETDIATSSSVTLSDLSWKIEPIKAESEAVEAVAEGKIAPGTWGYAAIKVTNESEVDANVTASISLPSVSNPGGLSFKAIMVKGDTAPTSYDGASGELNTAVQLAKKGDTTESLTIYVCFQWLYEASADVGTNDVNDTALGAAAAEISFSSANLTITATQVEPQKAE